MTRVTIFGESDSTRVTLRNMVTRLESRFSQNDSARVTINDSRLEWKSFLQNLRASDWQTQFVCVQRNDHFWSSSDQKWCQFSVLSFNSCYAI